MDNGASATSVLRETPCTLRAPAIQALLIQCLSFLVMLVLIRGLWMFGGVPVTVFAAALLQGAIAAVISHWRGLAPWWLPIRLIFPGALMAVHALQLPSAIFLCAFILLLSLYWTTPKPGGAPVSMVGGFNSLTFPPGFCLKFFRIPS